MSAWEITRKDLKLLGRDRRALMVLVLLPLAFITILGLSTGRLLGWRAENQILKMAVAVESDSELAQRVVSSLDRRDSLQVIRVASAEEARHLVSAREVNAALIVGSEFEDRVEALKLRDIIDADGGPLAEGVSALDMSVEARTSAFGIRSITEQLVLAATLQVVAPHIARKNKIVNRLLSSSRSEESSNQEPTATSAPGTQGKRRSASAEAQAAASNPVYETLVPGFTVMFAFFLVNIMARSFLSERETGTLQRLSMAPITRNGLLLGKTIPFLIISLGQSLLLFLFGKLLFGMSWGVHPWLLLPILFCTSVSATGLGLLVATTVRTDSQVSAYANFLVITMAGISGCFMPRDWLPELMQQISLATPHAWSLIAYDQALTVEVPNTTTIAQCCAVLLGFGSLFFGVGSWRFRTLV
ncbi:MAG TPA: hypothetical protein EYP14_08850 [Planctomycetaceae bacterium]|nr:hypothetical protein [Planctomycetaceae bacterium]